MFLNPQHHNMREFYINKSKDKKSRVVEKLLGRHPRFFLEEILNNNFPVKAPFSFIQIGANDGVSFDSLYDMVLQRKSKGVVVEPLSDYFQS